MGLEGSAVISLMNAIVPLYISIALGYSLSKLKVVTYKTHYAGIVTFCFKITLPALFFRLVATNNPYALNLQLIGADTLSKVIVLLVLSLGCYWRPTAQGVAWVYAYFNLATFSNTVLVGIPLVTALYPGTEKDLTALIVMQALLWFPVCIFILELYKVLQEKNPGKENEERELQLGGVIVELNSLKDGSLTHPQSLSSSRSGDETRRISNFDQGQKDSEGTDHEGPRPAASNSVSISVDATEKGHHQGDSEIHRVESGPYSSKDTVHPVADSSLPESPVDGCKLSRLRVVKRILGKVAVNFLWSPIVWASLFGFAYALLNIKFNQGKPLPAILKTSVALLANCTLGMAMFMLGMHMAAHKNLLPGGIYKVLWGTVVRFFISPAVMALASLIAGLRGRMFRFAVLQAMIPQAISSFIFACNYHIHEDTFSTAVWFQTLIFFPFAIALYSVLELGA
ncbi:hypothetical protein R1flu_001791 [Riccia fluitans]|uniref:Auxin efflux carrier component n=1 Tax=Riccia fluitans TaxID=41844 RepID=A0ABD1Y4P4_9MARC